MTLDWIRLGKLTVAILTMLFFSVLIIQYEFPAFEYAEPSPELVDLATTSVGLEVSRFLWTYRYLDLIAQAFVLFASAACCVAILRTEAEKK